MKRYDPINTYEGDGAGQMKEQPDGDFVKYSGHREEILRIQREARVMECTKCGRHKHVNEFSTPDECNNCHDTQLTEHSDLDLQLFLAKQLPEEIGYLPPSNPPAWPAQFYWRESDIVFGTEVTPREWDYIVRCVEEKLTPSQRELYWFHLCEELQSCHIMSTALIVDAITCSWQIRARALMQILK